MKRGSSLGGDSGPGGVVLQRNNIEIVEVKVPGNKCGLIIGKGGETIKRLSEQFGVKLVVVQETSVASGSDKPLRITGEPDKVAAAKSAILEMLNPNDNYHQGGGDRRGGDRGRGDYGSKGHYGGPGQSEAFIKVPGDKAGIVIGKGGESIKDINRRSGAHVEIDKSQRGANDGNDKMFIIKGDAEQIQYAQQLIYEKITGVQGSQPPQGYFNDPNQASPMHGGYGSGGRNGSAAAYGAQQQQQYMGYGQGQQAGQQDPNVSAAWAAYYQQYAAYGAAGQQQPTGAAAVAGQPQAAATTAQPSVNPSTGQADYSQAWVEYYRSLGMYEQADAILKQNTAAATQQGGSTPTQQTNGAAVPAASAAAPTSSSSGSSSQSQSVEHGKQNGSSNGYGSGGSGGYGGGSGGYGSGQGSYGGGQGYSREHRTSGGH